MGDTRFDRHLHEIDAAPDRAAAIRRMGDAALVEALAAASKDARPYLANVLATELSDRVKRQASLLGKVPQGLLALDREGRIRFANPAAAELLGRPGEVLAGRRIAEVEQSAPERFLEPLTTGRPVERREAEIETSRGERRRVAFTASPVPGGTGPEGVVVLLREPAEDAAALDAHEAGYRDLFRE